VLLEIVSGRKCLGFNLLEDEKSEESLLNWVSLCSLSTNVCSETYLE
jgi:hypothetical protein